MRATTSGFADEVCGKISLSEKPSFALLLHLFGRDNDRPLSHSVVPEAVQARLLANVDTWAGEWLWRGIVGTGPSQILCRVRVSVPFSWCDLTDARYPLASDVGVSTADALAN